ncbi:Phosphoenolpyruvate carboxykinase (ATP) [Streptococcus gordonii]|uniref:Phosphoenolpyruvate carboxykinase (ATP) n=1 Tax=Streptococcus gordonii TaxID=1302 RepID=A0A139NFX0_STRGN|nr:Phosphoenolpyruvate carboxykinase (ATP) [Streptococcus gordonii]
MPVIHTKELGLPSYARVLLTNTGAVVGRTAKARRIYGRDSQEDETLLFLVRSAIYQAHHRDFYKADAVLLGWMKTLWSVPTSWFLKKK